MNQQQRKYLKTRLEGAYASKQAQIKGSLGEVEPAFKSKEERQKYINAAIKGNKKIASVQLDYYGRSGIITDKDAEYDKRVAAAKEAVNKKINELTKLYKKTMDEVMLGDDAEALTAALTKIEEFKVD